MKPVHVYGIGTNFAPVIKDLNLSTLTGIYKVCSYCDKYFYPTVSQIYRAPDGAKPIYSCRKKLVIKLICSCLSKLLW